MKDFFDLRFLAATFDVAGTELAGAIEATFARRNIAVPREVPTGLTDEFAADTAKQTQWRAFLRRSGLEREDLELATVVSGLRVFLLPPIEALGGGTPFDRDWAAGGPRRQRPSSGA
ncbi:MAG TPA: nucleotidyl transferase AbiEii/AbiGii toxin family protein [Planctomycetota bacterium]